MADMASVLEEMRESPQTSLRGTLVHRVKAAEQVAAQKNAADAAIEPNSFTSTFAAGLTFDQTSTGLPKESAAKQLLRFRSAQKAQGVDNVVLPATKVTRAGKKFTSPLFQQIEKSEISPEQQQTHSGNKGGSRNRNLRLKTNRSKGEGYGDRMQERLASKSHRKNRIARMKKMY